MDTSLLMCTLFMGKGTNNKQSRKNYGIVKDKEVRRKLKQREVLRCVGCGGFIFRIDDQGK